MMKYKVLEAFTDLTTNQVYWEGDAFPAPGLSLPDDSRLAELTSEKNKRKKALIEKIEVKEATSDEEISTEFPKHVGGGNYLLSDGTKVKGKEKANTQQSELNAEEE